MQGWWCNLQQISMQQEGWNHQCGRCLEGPLSFWCFSCLFDPSASASAAIMRALEEPIGWTCEFFLCLGLCTFLCPLVLFCWYLYTPSYPPHSRGEEVILKGITIGSAAQHVAQARDPRLVKTPHNISSSSSLLCLSELAGNIRTFCSDEVSDCYVVQWTYAIFSL